MENKVMSHMTKGLLAGLLLVVIGIAGYYTGLSEQSWFNWVSNAVLAVSVVWACVHYANQMDGNVTFGSVFAHGFKMTAIITLILIVYILLAMTVLFPEMKDKALEVARQKMEADGKITDDQMEQALKITKKFFVPIAIGAVLFGTLIFGAIASLIGAAIAKKNPNRPPQQFNV